MPLESAGLDSERVSCEEFGRWECPMVGTNGRCHCPSSVRLFRVPDPPEAGLDGALSCGIRSVAFFPVASVITVAPVELASCARGFICNATLRDRLSSTMSPNANASSPFQPRPEARDVYVGDSRR